MPSGTSRIADRSTGTLSWLSLWLWALLVAMLAGVLSHASRALGAEEMSQASDPSPWSFQVAPFLWLPEIQGKVSARRVSADIDVDFSRLFDLMGDGELFAGGGHFEGRYEGLTLFVDAFGGTARPTSDVVVGDRQIHAGTADVRLNFAFVEFGPAYRVLDWPQGDAGPPITIDLLTGGRFMYFYQSISLLGSAGDFARDANATSTWVDPFVGGRFSVPLSDDLAVVFRGDIGGFGAGSQLAWNLIGGFQYGLPWQPFGARTSLVAVYKALDFDYEGGSKDVVADLDLRGPALGLSFEF